MCKDEDNREMYYFSHNTYSFQYYLGRRAGLKMAANLIDEIKATEEKAAKSLRETRNGAAKKLNKAAADAENTVKETKQSSAKQFREKIQMTERIAEAKARSIVSEREAGAKAFYAKHREKIAAVAAWITEEVMVRYGRS
jgi:vacuolar-type H+-ATPase subunit H